MDLSIDEPLSPVLRPPRQSMHSNDSGSDGDEVMGTGIASPRSQVEHANQWNSVDPESASGSVSERPLADAEQSSGVEAESAPTWGEVLGSLKTWGITPSSQSAAVSPVSGRSHMAQGAALDAQVGQRQRSLQLDSQDSLLEDAEHAENGDQVSGALPTRPASAGAALAALNSKKGSEAAKQRSDRLSSSLDSSEVGLARHWCCMIVALN